MFVSGIYCRTKNIREEKEDESLSVGAEYAVKMHHVTKTFGKVTANKDVNLELRTGEILALLGENGRGKTTLMNMLSGIYFPDHGEIYVKGEEVTIRSPKDSFALGIGMIHQHFKLVDVLTAAENIVLGLDGKVTVNRREINKKVGELAQKYGFDLDPYKKVYNMSVSEKQTVEILKVLYKGGYTDPGRAYGSADSSGDGTALYRAAEYEKRREVYYHHYS